MRLRVLGAALLFMALSGCERRYLVEESTLRELAAVPRSAQRLFAVAARRANGTPVLVRADSIVETSLTPPELQQGLFPLPPGTMRVGRRRSFVAVGVFLDAVGGAMLTGGAAFLPSTLTDDTPFSFILASGLMVSGLGHLVPGIVLTAVGAAADPEDVRGLISLPDRDSSK